MKKTKPTSTQPCSYCDNRATHKNQHMYPLKYACSEHKPELLQHEVDNHDDGYMSEGDYQSWGRL